MEKKSSQLRKQHFLKLFFWIAFFFPLVGIAQGFLRQEGQKIVNEAGENVLLRGIGLGGWMLQEGYMLGIYSDGQQHKIRERIEALIGKDKTNEFYETWLANFITKADIDSLKAWGFNSVRLPMHYRLFTLSTDEEPIKGENTWLQKGFQLTDSLLSWCRLNKMYLILDMHAAPGGQGNDLNISDRNPRKPSLWQSEVNQKKLVALWQKLATHYADEPWIGGYDIINEPNWGFVDPEKDKNGLSEKLNIPLKKLMMDITQAIRQADKKHIIIIEGNGWGNNYNGILPPWDDNMVLSFHKYWNYNTEASIKQITGYSKKYNVPIWLGETGENSNVWFTNAVQLAERNNIGWAWWPLKKLGLNNPLQIPMNQGYQDILAYWKDGKNKPDTLQAAKSLLQLAAETNNKNNNVRYDVIDALIRQPHTNVTLPFKQHIIKESAVLTAVDYDLGKNGYAYFDTDTANHRVSTGKDSDGNTGGKYRNDAVDIKETEQASGQFYVTDMMKGEWLQYTIQILQTGNYNIGLNISSPGNAGVIKLMINDNEIGQAAIPVLKSTEGWENIIFAKVPLTQGQQKIRIIMEKGRCNFSSIHFTKL